MKREIKFRGKSLETGEWLYGDLYHTDELACICDWGIRPHTVENFAVNSDTVGQFTGLYDKNGKEIYEGDILKVTQIRPKFMPNVDLGIAVVEFSPWLGWSVGTRYDRYAFDPTNSIDTIEIIGNIHDNPGLLLQ